MRLSNLSELPYCGESLLLREPPALRLLVVAVLSLVVSVCAFVFLGSMDEVVRATGAIRPDVNISLVRNVVPGEIAEIRYRPGQLVPAGAVLFRIQPDSLLAQRRSLGAQLEGVRFRIAGLDSILRSVRAGADRVPSANETAAARFASWFDERRLLAEKARMARLLWEEERRLPPSGTTAASIRKFEHEAEIAAMNLCQFESSFVSLVMTELDGLRLEAKTLAEELAKTENSLRLTEVRSPLAGAVQEISSLNPGDWLSSDQQVLKIVPSDLDRLRVELRIPARDAGKLRLGMNVKLRFPAFPYDEFRGATGTIRNIDPDAVASESGALFFTVLADIDRTELCDRRGVEYPLRAGIETDARIVLDRLRIVSFIMRKMNLWL